MPLPRDVSKRAKIHLLSFLFQPDMAVWQVSSQGVVQSMFPAINRGNTFHTKQMAAYYSVNSDRDHKQILQLLQAGKTGGKRKLRGQHGDGT